MPARSRNNPSQAVTDLSNYDGSGGAGLISAAARTTYTSGTGDYLAPFIASLNADASGTVGVLEAQQVSITGIDDVFEVTLSNADAAKILNAFKVADVDGSGGTFANIEVSMDASGEQDFHDALAAAVDSADLKDANASSLYAWLKAEARADTVTLLSYDTLANMLEASDLATFDIAIDASGGAADLYGKMNDSGAADRRAALFRQIARAEVESYLVPSDGTSASMEAVSTLRFLPLKKGSKLTFVFDCTVGDYSSGNAPTSGAKITAASSAALTNTVSAAGAVPASIITVANNGQVSASLNFSTPTRRRVAVTLVLGSGSGNFDLEPSGDLSGDWAPQLDVNQA